MEMDQTGHREHIRDAFRRLLVHTRLDTIPPFLLSHGLDRILLLLWSTCIARAHLPCQFLCFEVGV